MIHRDSKIKICIYNLIILFPIDNITTLEITLFDGNSTYQNTSVVFFITDGVIFVSFIDLFEHFHEIRKDSAKSRILKIELD